MIKRLLMMGFIAVFLSAVSGLAQDKDSDSVRIVTTGQILKIDAKKRTFQFRVALDDFPRGRGYGGPRGSRGRGAPYPQPDNVQYTPTIEVKVFVSDRTILKSGDGTLDFAKLRIGDRISMTGIHRGKNLEIEALEIDK